MLCAERAIADGGTRLAHIQLRKTNGLVGRITWSYYDGKRLEHTHALVAHSSKDEASRAASLQECPEEFGRSQSFSETFPSVQLDRDNGKDMRFPKTAQGPLHVFGIDTCISCAAPRCPSKAEEAQASPSPPRPTAHLA